MTKRIFRSICLVAIAVLIAALVLIMGVLYEYFSIIQSNQLKMETQLAAEGVENNGQLYLEAISANDTRFTWISPDGQVIYDNWFDPKELENHLEREEVKEAFASGYGESIRYSDSLTGRQLYAAQRLSDGSVLRLGTSQKTVLTLIFGMVQPTVIVLTAAILLSLALAFSVSRKIVKPLNELDLECPPTEGEYEELNPLLRRLSTQQIHLKKQESELRRKQDEFNTATDGMSEGIVLIGEKRVIISMNRSAATLLGASDRSVGRDICVLDPSFGIEALLEEAEITHHAEKVITRNNQSYRMIASPVISDNRNVGFALLIFDITEKESAEKMRREFTANVSHELKTPLHSISGCAELLCNGMVKPEDVPEFANQIYTESGRMIRLIDDIIKLSRLDEGDVETGRTDVDLYTLAEGIVDELRVISDQDNITLSLEGEHVTVNGIPQMLTAIIRNLCDNAVKYNRSNGWVKVSVTESENAALLIVSDSGIGIAKEHQERIFERFFRVDKSHSKEVGGTGLGLSIVKHAARLHGAEIKLESAPNEGTTVTVAFPKE